ncbi:DMT family transporter [Granulicella arctica]|uniref:DMT family transporter n=1 Tax=Granulicella arctica TaxID=940613 RepID=UPI0021E0E7F8|nr:DMT family transporter [Granulicella arctica]
MRPSTLAHLLLIAVVAVWGATFVLVKDAFRDISPLLFNLLRMALAFLALALINRRELRTLTRKSILSGLFVGAFLGAGYQFQTAGLARTTPAKAAFITGLIVVFVPLFTIIPRLRPKGANAPGLATIAGALFAFSGLLLLTTPAGTALAHIFATIGLGDLLVLLCALAFAAHLLALARASLHLSAGLLATLQIGAATLLMAVTLPFDGRPVLHLTGRLVFALAITSLFATAAAFTIQSYAQQHLSPSHTALILTLEPVFAWLTSILILHEHLGPRALTGALLILIGIAIIELLPNRSAPTPIPA